MITKRNWKGWTADPVRLVLEHPAMPGYEVDLESIATKMDALSWILHLSEKRGWSGENVTLGFLEALKACCDPRILPDVAAPKQEHRDRLVKVLRRFQQRDGER